MTKEIIKLMRCPIDTDGETCDKDPETCEKWKRLIALEESD